MAEQGRNAHEEANGRDRGLPVGALFTMLTPTLGARVFESWTAIQ